MENITWDTVIAWGIKILVAILIFVIGRWIARKISELLKKVMEKRNVDVTLAGFLGNIAYSLLLVMVVLSSLQQLGIPMLTFTAVLGASTLAIGLALQGSLGNFASGVMIMLFKPFRVGDFIDAGGKAGIVLDIRIFDTHMKSPDNKRIIVPNGQITSSPITNFTAEDKRRIDFVFGVSYDDDIKKVKSILQEIVDADDRILKDPAPTIGLLEMADSSLNFCCRPWVKTSEYWDVFFAIQERVKERFDAEGISIPFPQRDVHIFNPEKGSAA